MNREQKMAWWMVISILTGIAASVAAIVLLKSFVGLAFMGIAGFGGLGPLIFRKDRGGVTFDERDKLIKRRSALAGFAAAYLFVGLACMIPFSVLGPKATVPVTWLPMIFMGAGLSSFFFGSLSLLIQYGRGGGDGK
jgi:hypothetical protein